MKKIVLLFFMIYQFIFADIVSDGTLLTKDKFDALLQKEISIVTAIVSQIEDKGIKPTTIAQLTNGGYLASDFDAGNMINSNSISFVVSNTAITINTNIPLSDVSTAEKDYYLNNLVNTVFSKQSSATSSLQTVYFLKRKAVNILKTQSSLTTDFIGDKEPSTYSSVSTGSTWLDSNIKEFSIKTKYTSGWGDIATSNQTLSEDGSSNPVTPLSFTSIVKQFSSVTSTEQQSPIICDSGANYNALGQRCEAYTSNACDGNYFDTTSNKCYKNPIDYCRAVGYTGYNDSTNQCTKTTITYANKITSTVTTPAPMNMETRVISTSHNGESSSVTTSDWGDSNTVDPKISSLVNQINTTAKSNCYNSYWKKVLCDRSGITYRFDNITSVSQHDTDYKGAIVNTDKSGIYTSYTEYTILRVKDGKLQTRVISTSHNGESSSVTTSDWGDSNTVDPKISSLVNQINTTVKSNFCGYSSYWKKFVCDRSGIAYRFEDITSASQHDTDYKGVIVNTAKSGIYTSYTEYTILRVKDGKLQIRVISTSQNGESSSVTTSNWGDLNTVDPKISSLVNQINTTAKSNCYNSYWKKVLCDRSGITYRFDNITSVSQHDTDYKGAIVNTDKSGIYTPYTEYTILRVKGNCASGTLSGGLCYSTQLVCGAGYTDNGANCKKTTTAFLSIPSSWGSGYYLTNNAVNGKDSYIKNPSCSGKKMTVTPFYNTPHYGNNGLCYSDVGLYCKNTGGLSYDGIYTCFKANQKCSSGYSLKYNYSGGNDKCSKYNYTCPSISLYGLNTHPTNNNPANLLSRITNKDAKVEPYLTQIVNKQNIILNDNNGSMCVQNIEKNYSSSGTVYSIDGKLKSAF